MTRARSRRGAPRTSASDRGVTIKDVARAAGVSIATVSRVWNNNAPVSEATRAHVQAVAARLGYSPHGAARSLITSRTTTIGALLPDLYGEFFSEVIRGIDETAQRSGYHLLVSSSHDDQREITAALRTMRGRVDGLIVMAPDVDAHAALRILPARFPVVLLNSALDGDPYDAILIDNYAGACAMVQYLIGLGHRRLAHITGAPRNYDALERRRAFRDTVRAAGLQTPDIIEVGGDFGELSGYRSCAELVRAPHPPTAIFAANDAMAMGALSALREAGIAVPARVSVAGFDDIPMARYMNPPLTSVNVDIYGLGERAAHRLLETMRDGGAPPAHRRERRPTRLVIRDSCGPPG